MKNFSWTSCTLTLFLGVLIAACSSEPTPPDASLPQFELVEAARSGIQFKNWIDETPNRNVGTFDYFYNGAGVGVGDLNGDGRPDIFFTGNDASNQLYFNKGELQFEEVTAKAGLASSDKWSTGVTLADINSDGYLDIYVCNAGPSFKANKLANQLFINNGDGTFSEQASQYGIAGSDRSIQAAFFDMDLDGDLDLFVMNHALRSHGASAQEWLLSANDLPVETIQQESNKLYRNEGNGRFTNISAQAGVNKRGFGLGLSISDIDENGYPDIYVANDYFVPDFLFLNQGNGTFKESVKARVPHTSYFSMGCDLADINNDGLQDLAVADMTPADHFRNKTLMASMNVAGFDFLTQRMNYIPQYMFNTLQLNRSRGVFSEIGLMAGMSQTDWSWAVLLADYDNDGLKDLFITNGFFRDTKDNDWKATLAQRRATEGSSAELYFEHLQTANSTPIPNVMFNNQGTLQFADKTSEWGLDMPTFSHGAAYADFDQDGDLDLVINNLNAVASIYKNNASARTGHHYIRFQLEAPKGQAINAQVRLEYGNQVQVVENAFTRGYQSFVEPVVHFGLGQNAQIDRAIITWPNGKQTILAQPTVDRTHTIKYDPNQSTAATKVATNPPFIDIIAQQKRITYRHAENDFNDFDKEILLPHSQSRQGPALAVGDVNGDGLDDFYVGGGKDQVGQLYVQDQNGIFSESEQIAFGKARAAEDVGAHFFDADQDGDLDLYVASGGGGDFEATPNLLQDRLYLNEKGQFSNQTAKLPQMLTSTASIAPVDFDQDGDVDIFVGGRTSPGRYPSPPPSYLLENNKGNFTISKQAISDTFETLGMVTQAIWTDLDQDTWPDLMVVGEWMPIKVFHNQKGMLVEKTELDALNELKGWWYSIAEGDFDNDGDTDFVIGNLGLNNKFHPNEQKGLEVYWEDFDDNGIKDIVLSKYYKGAKVPVRGKECSTQQMPFLANKYQSYARFASSTLDGIYGAEKLSTALHYEATTFASVLLINEGDFQFRAMELPKAAQLAPINDQVIYDFDKDGNLDIVIGGNLFTTEVETPAYDGGRGLFLQGNGDGTFRTSLNMMDSGIFMPNDVRQLAFVKLSRAVRPCILVANNDSRLQMLVYRNGL
ncbi:MAG: VCBS repeat-containing protein [Bacteroidota bacterium]